MADMTRAVGRYEILEEVGRGGMAVVYLARQTDLDRLVALKELAAFHASDPAFARRFLRESRLAGSLSHPNIVTVHEYFEHDGTPYIAMEYIERGSLRPYIGKLSLAQVVGVLESILAGLAHAEAKGIVHRDMKPENVMVTDDGRVKIADFGIAKASAGMSTGQFLTATGTTVGTPTYMAPEQAMAKDIGPWTDLYSVGVMSYEMLVGRLPYADTEAPMALLMKHINEPVPPPRSINPDLDPELADWIERLLAKTPDDRIRSATTAWDELEESVIRIFGARWRREARLPKPAAAADPPAPLTPAPFTEVFFDDRAPRPSAPESDEFQSFAWNNPPAAPVTRPPEETPAPPAAPPEPPVVAPAPSSGTPPPIEVAAAAADPVAAEAAAEPLVGDRDPAFVTYGRRQAPPRPPEPEPVAAPEEAVAAAPPAAVEAEEWPATVAPNAAPAPPQRAEPAHQPARPAGEKRAQARKSALWLVGATVAVAALVGWLVAPSGKKSQASPPALAGSASSSALQLRFPDTWRRAEATPQVSGLELADPVALSGRPAGAAIVAGTSGASDPTLLPDGLLARLGSSPRATTVALGRTVAYRYDGLVAKSPTQRLTVFAIPTTGGVVTLACLGAAVGSPDCERIASTLRLQNVQALKPGPDPAYARALSAVIGGLNTQRARSQSAMAVAARSPAAYARAATSLAGAYASAATTLRTLSVSPLDRTANAKVLAAMASAAHAYRAVASAARNRDRGAYRKASADAARGERGVADALVALRTRGYTVG